MVHAGGYSQIRLARENLDEQLGASCQQIGSRSQDMIAASV
jgi:hypothetical protein